MNSKTNRESAQKVALQVLGACPPGEQWQTSDIDELRGDASGALFKIVAEGLANRVNARLNNACVEIHMPDLRGTTQRGCRKLRTASILIICCLAFTSGCKTSDDAAAAATQLTATASSLTGYYSALDTLLSETDQLYQIQAAINPLAPYDTPTKNYVTDTAAEIQKREKLAAALTTLAREFAKLSRSTAATDASTAAGNLETAVAGLKISGVSMSTSNVNMMKDAVDLIVKAIQEHKEREAAAAIDKFTSALNTSFQSEEPFYNTIGSTYANVTQSLAKALINQGQVDPSQFLNAVFSPYGLTPQLTDPTIKSKMQTILAAQVDQESAALEASQQTATTNMEKSLSEMASRIHLVAIDKPMAIRVAPPTLTEVQNWISLVPQIAPAASTTAAKSTTSTGTKSN